jgi:hypothetical protein
MERKTDLGIKIVLKLAEIVAERLRKTDKELSKLKSQLDDLVSMREKSARPSGEENNGHERASSSA